MLMRLFVSLWMGLLPAVAIAQIPDARFQEAMAQMRQYAQDMTKVVPCLYVAMTGPDPNLDMVDKTWGEAATREAMDGLRRAGATAEQLARLRAIYRDNYRPNWSVADVRAFGRACYPIIADATAYSGVATPLGERSPFSAYK